MDSTAIKQIQNESAVKQQVAKIESLDIPAVALPKDFSVENLEKFMDAPTRFRGTYRTDNLIAFAEYNNDKKKGICFISSSNAIATSSFDLGDEENPGHGDHRATLQLTPTSEYTEQQKIEGETLTQIKFAEWLEDWRHFVQIKDQNGNDMHVNAAIQSARKVTLRSTQSTDHNEQHYKSSRSAMEEIEAKAEHGIPAYITFTCKPHENFEERDFVMRVSLLTQRDVPHFKLRTIQLQLIKDAIAEEFQQKLTAELNENVTTHIGTFQQ